MGKIRLSFSFLICTSLRPQQTMRILILCNNPGILILSKRVPNWDTNTPNSNNINDEENNNRKFALWYLKGTAERIPNKKMATATSGMERPNQGTSFKRSGFTVPTCDREMMSAKVANPVIACNDGGGEHSLNLERLRRDGSVDGSILV